MNNLFNDEKLKSLAPVVLRIGMALVFFYFGYMQLTGPEKWISFLPNFTQSLPFSQITFVLLNGWFEIIGGVMILIGVYTRIVALLLAIHLFGIAMSIGFGPLGVRDFGLSVATLGLALYGAGKFSVDNLENKTQIQ
ncbi:DoxX family protein [Candidatus Nomurabacteria bacterium]|nr:DoxX family protein [Candidatus Nomurabacteria bacterium]